MLGHPSGMSIKLTKDGIVTETKQPGYFSCHLDAFSGNSGSPVFDFEKQKIIGILTAGGEDYEITNNYRNTKKTRIQAHCVTNGHEKCQRMSSLLIELERNGALNERPFPENEVENFLTALKNNYKRQKNIPRLLHKDPLPINVVYTQLVLLQKISKKIEDEEIKTENKNMIKTTNDKNFKQIYKERGISNWEDIRTSKKPIDLEKLFEKSENQNSAPKQLLIMGKAGVGKSTLCQHIAFQWAHGKLWNEKFDALFWVPLRKLQDIEPNETVSSFLFRSCCLGNHELYPCEIMDYVKNNQDKILFVLDGYDEFDPLNQAQKEIVDQLQKHPYWILTSRPYAVQAIKADAIIENVGFTSETIEQYIHNALPLKQKEKAGLIIQKIRQNPIVFGICHIPINLELVFTLLETMDEKKNSPFSISTMTDLYSLLTCTLQRRFLMRIQGKNDFLNAENETIDDEIKNNKNTSCLFEFLEATAWIGLKNKELEFSYNEGVLENLYLKFRPQKTSEQEHFRKYFKESGFIHSIGKSSSFTECKFSFIHLTFQEFFAARYLVSLLKNKENCSEGEKLIKEIKFNPRYLIVMWFMAGLLKNDKDHLNHFFELLGHSEEMAGLYPALLKVRCLEECGWTKKIEKIKEYEKEIQFWCNQMKNPFVGRIIEQFLVETFEISPISTKRILSPVLDWMCQESELSIFMYYNSIYLLAKPKRIIPMLIQNLTDENSEWTISVLSQIGCSDIERFLPLIKEALENSSDFIKKHLIKTLTEVGQTHLQQVLSLLQASLNDEEKEIRVETIQALGSLEKIDPKIIYPLLKEVLIEAFEKNDQELIYTTIKALCETTQVNSSEFFSFVEKILENENLKIAGVYALGYIHKEENLLPLNKIVTDPVVDLKIKEEIPLALGRIGRKNPTFAFNLLKKYIENESKSEFHFGLLSAIDALGEIGHIYPTESLDLLDKFLENMYFQLFNESEEDINPKRNIDEESIDKFIENKFHKKLKKIDDFLLIAKLIESIPNLFVMLTVTAIGKIASQAPERAIELLKKALLFNTKAISRRVFITFGRIANAAPLFRASLIELLEENFININLEDDIRGGAAIGLALACKDAPKIIVPLFEKIFIQKNSKFLIKDLFNALSLFQEVDLQFAHSFMLSQNLKNLSYYTLAEQMDWSLHPKKIKKLAIELNKTKRIKNIKFGSRENKREKKELTNYKSFENFNETTNIDEKTPLLINSTDTLKPISKIDTEIGEIAENDTMFKKSYSSYIIVTPHKNLLSRTTLSSLIDNYSQQTFKKSDYIYPIILKCLEENTVIFFEDNALCFYEKDKIHRIDKFCDLPLFKNSLKEKLSEKSENSQDIPLIEENIDQSFDDENPNRQSKFLGTSISTAKDHLSFIHEEMYSNFSKEVNYDKNAHIILKSSPVEPEDMVNYNPKPINIDCNACCKIL